jgi:hypothetical protein
MMEKQENFLLKGKLSSENGNLLKKPKSGLFPKSEFNYFFAESPILSLQPYENYSFSQKVYRGS